MVMNNIILFDINEDLCSSWRKYFKEEIDKGLVTVCNQKFEELECNCVITAGNSYGWMTGGIDLVVRNYYGQFIQDRIQQIILSMPNRMLPVGESIILNTGDIKKPYLIYAPTMDVPKGIDTLDVFYVFAKLLREYTSGFACCGLGTGTGNIDYDDCAKAMYDAYKYVVGNDENRIN